MILDNIYQFYNKLDEEQRIELVLNNEEVIDAQFPDTIYFPVQLSEKGAWMNYNLQQGLIAVSPVLDYQGKYFKVYAKSPDDLDLDLMFNGQETELRPTVIEYVRQLLKVDVTYRGILKNIRHHFGAGKIYE